MRLRAGPAPAIHDGDVVKWLNTEVCKTSIHRFESGRRLHSLSTNRPTGRPASLRFARPRPSAMGTIPSLAQRRIPQILLATGSCR